MYTLKPDEAFIAGDASDPDLDFAIVAVAPTSQRGVPVSHWGYLRLDAQPGKVAEGEYVTIIQVSR